MATNTVEKARVEEILNAFKGVKPPYHCPVDDCSRPCLGLMSLKHHLLKCHKGRFGQSENLVPDSENVDADEWGEDSTPEETAADNLNCITTTANAIIPGKVASISKSRLASSARKKKRLRFSRKSRTNGGSVGATNKAGSAASIYQSPLSPTTRIQHATSGMSYEESLRIATFEVQGNTYKVSIDEPIPIEFVSDKEDDPAEELSTSQVAASESGISHRQVQKRQVDVPSFLPVKLPEVQVRELHYYKYPFVPKLPDKYRVWEEKCGEALDAELEYVMDDMDYAWLSLINHQTRAPRGLPDVPYSDFTLLMDRLEKDSYFEPTLESQGHHSAWMEEEAVCCICQDGEAANTNVILFCDMCNLPVHQECYGVPYIPEGQWVCRRCLLSPSQPVTCQLCPIKTGAFKQTTKSKWCHVSCALWIPEVQFANTVFLEPIENLEHIPAARFKLCCYICKRRNVGACIQCSKQNCFTAFHIACGQSVGLHIKLEPIKDPEHSPALVNVKKVAYCDVHTPSDSDRKPLINTNPDDPESREDQKRNSKKLKQIFAQRQSGSHTVSLPEISPERLEAIAARVSFPHKVQFLTRLHSYWLLRRHGRNGVPLIKRLQLSHLQKQQQRAQAALDKSEHDNVPGEEKDLMSNVQSSIDVGTQSQEENDTCVSLEEEDEEEDCFQKSFELLCCVDERNLRVAEKTPKTPKNSQRRNNTSHPCSAISEGPHPEMSPEPDVNSTEESVEWEKLPDINLNLEQFKLKCSNLQESLNSVIKEFAKFTNIPGSNTNTLLLPLPFNIDNFTPEALNAKIEEPIKKTSAVTSCKKKELSIERCVEHFRKSYCSSLYDEHQFLDSTISFETVQSCCDALRVLRDMSATKRLKMYHCVVQGKLVSRLKKLTEKEKFLEKVLSDHGIKLESTQRNNFVKLYAVAEAYPDFYFYDVTASYVLKNIYMVKDMFAKGLLNH